MALLLDLIAPAARWAGQGNLFYNVLGGSAGSSISSTHNANYSLFSNIDDFIYWSFTGIDSNDAWDFNMFNGNLDGDNQVDHYNVWAVYSGDVSAIREPGTLVLFCLGLVGLGFTRKLIQQKVDSLSLNAFSRLHKAVC